MDLALKFEIIHSAWVGHFNISFKWNNAYSSVDMYAIQYMFLKSGFDFWNFILTSMKKSITEVNEQRFNALKRIRMIRIELYLTNAKFIVNTKPFLVFSYLNAYALKYQ